MSHYFNPYYDTTFLGFFCRLIKRLFTYDGALASDELQMLILCCIATSAAIVGSFLILRKMTMLANSLSHTVLIGIVLAYLLIFIKKPFVMQTAMPMSIFLVAALISALITTFLTEFLTKVVKLQEDASIGLVFSILFALGIVLVTLFTRNAHIGAEIVMGNVDALHPSDLKLAFIALLFNVVITLLFFKEYTITTFDPIYAKTVHISLFTFNSLIMLQTAITTIAGFRAIGVLMILAFLVIPPIIARLFTARLYLMILLAIAVGIVVSICSVALSRHLLSVYHLSLSTGGLTVCLLSLALFISLIFAPQKGLITAIKRKKLINRTV